MASALWRGDVGGLRSGFCHRFSEKSGKFEAIVRAVRLTTTGNSSRAGVWLIFGPIMGARMSREPPKMCLTP